GESMFSACSNGSKVALLALCAGLARWGFPLLDAQMATPHLSSLGAFELPRARFCAQVAALCAQPGREGSWRGLFPFKHAAELTQPSTTERT
ncbi:MAG: leucyl/phenylalanyl-tRNA--protein transferase, partial [Dokdonella sp.]|nr:leucyl/phenylalanyl-tRNA--protein transferase [Dokdonella sp.]